MIVQWTKTTGATFIHRGALIRSNEIETAAGEWVSARMFGRRLGVHRERGQRITFVRLWRFTGVPFLSVCMCPVAETGCSTESKGNDAVWQLRKDNDADDVIGAPVASGLWLQPK